MILSRLFSVFKKVDEKEWILAQENALKEKHRLKISALEQEYGSKIVSSKNDLLEKVSKYERMIRDAEDRTHALSTEHDRKIREMESEFDRKCADIQKAHALRINKIISDNDLIEEDLSKKKKALELDQFDVSELEKRVSDKKRDLETKNKELADQLRLIEAKASPDNVWIMAFQSGFSKAWGMMKPMMYEGFEKVKEEITTNAKLETIKNLQSELKGNAHGSDSKTN